MSENELQQLQITIQNVVRRVLQEGGAALSPTTTTAVVENLVPATPPLGKVLVGVCCSECVNEQALQAIETISATNLSVLQPPESEFKKRAPREKLVNEFDVVLLPAIGDDDAAKMALGIFDEPVARLALTALAFGKPLYAALNSPYDEALKKNSPTLRRVFEGHRRALENHGFNILPPSELASTVLNLFRTPSITSTMTSSVATGGQNVGGKKQLVTAQDIEAAARNGGRLQLPAGALITPLARDRARELGIALN